MVNPVETFLDVGFQHVMKSISAKRANVRKQTNSKKSITCGPVLKANKPNWFHMACVKHAISEKQNAAYNGSG